MEECSIKDLTAKVQMFCEERDWDQFHNPKDLAIGVSTEANELLDIFRFKSEEQMKSQFADASTRIHIEECLEDKLVKNAEKYPVEGSKGSNKKYNEK